MVNLKIVSSCWFDSRARAVYTLVCALEQNTTHVNVYFCKMRGAHNTEHSSLTMGWQMDSNNSTNYYKMLAEQPGRRYARSEAKQCFAFLFCISFVTFNQGSVGSTWARACTMKRETNKRRALFHVWSRIYISKEMNNDNYFKKIVRAVGINSNDVNFLIWLNSFIVNK